MKKALIFFWGLILVLAMVRSCPAVTLSFDSLALGFYDEAAFSSLFEGVMFDNTGGSQFEVRDASILQPDFSGNAILNFPFNTMGNSTIATFDSLTDFVSVTLGDGGGDDDTFFLETYDSSNNPIDSVSMFNPSTSFAGHTLSSSTSIPTIAWAKFYGVGINNNSAFWDNFTFNIIEESGPKPFVVPEPASLSLLAIGILGLFGIKKASLMN